MYIYIYKYIYIYTYVCVCVYDVYVCVCVCVCIYLTTNANSPCGCQINNPDMRVVILKEFVKANFPTTPLLDYAIEVEKITTSKVHSGQRSRRAE